MDRNSKNILHIHHMGQATLKTNKNPKAQLEKMYAQDANYVITGTAKEYLLHSTLHGLRYLADDNISFLGRIFWLAAFVLAVIAAIYFIVSIYIKYLTNPIIISLNQTPTPVREVPFPSITICNLNMVKKSVADVIQRNGTDLEKNFLSSLCRFEQTKSLSPSDTVNRDEVFEFLKKEKLQLTSTYFSRKYYSKTCPSWNRLVPERKKPPYAGFRFVQVSQPCDQMIQVCKWHARDVDCATLFRPVITEQGFCCNFNQLPLNYTYKNTEVMIKYNWSNNLNVVDDWNPDRGYRSSDSSAKLYPFRSIGPGAHLGLSLTLDTNIDEYYCSFSGSSGMKFLLHNPAEAPFLTRNSFTIPPSCETRVIFRPVLKDASENLQSMDVEKRHCYFTNEKYLKHYRTYTKINCKLECLANLTLDKCGCVPFYLPRSTSLEVCGTAQQNCSTTLRNAVDLWNMEELQACNCQAGCFELEYEKTMSYGRFTSGVKVRPDVLGTVHEPYFVNNMVVVQFYFVTTQFSKYTKSEIYSFSEYLSNTGGLLGVFLGFSWLSVIEIIYYALKIVCKKIRNEEMRQV